MAMAPMNCIRTCTTNLCSFFCLKFNRRNLHADRGEKLWQWYKYSNELCMVGAESCRVPIGSRLELNKYERREFLVKEMRDQTSTGSSGNVDRPRASGGSFEMVNIGEPSASASQTPEERGVSHLLIEVFARPYLIGGHCLNFKTTRGYWYSFGLDALPWHIGAKSGSPIRSDMAELENLLFALLLWKDGIGERGGNDNVKIHMESLATVHSTNQAAHRAQSLIDHMTLCPGVTAHSSKSQNTPTKLPNWKCSKSEEFLATFYGIGVDEFHKMDSAPARVDTSSRLGPINRVDFTLDQVLLEQQWWLSNPCEKCGFLFTDPTTWWLSSQQDDPMD